MEKIMRTKMKLMRILITMNRYVLHTEQLEIDGRC